MSNEEFDNLKEELMWEGSSVVMLSMGLLFSILKKIHLFQQCYSGKSTYLLVDFNILNRQRRTEVSGSFNGLCFRKTNFD